MFRQTVIAAVAIAGSGLTVAPAAAHPAGASAAAWRLTGADTADSPLGDGTALMVGPSGVPIPSPSYLDAYDKLLLTPRGFTGSSQSLPTPEGLYPNTGVKTLELNPSVAQGEQILDAAIRQQIAGGHVDAANPVVVTGWSQSSTIESLTMPQLASQGVPSDDVHFVMVGNPSNPDGGLLERFDVLVDGQSPTIPSFGVTFTGATPDDLYPTDIYTLEYDGFADFPQYTIDLPSDLNAILGLAIEHDAYLGLTSAQIADATRLPTSADDTLTDYYMVNAGGLPLLDPLQLLPVVGKPLYDLLEPDMAVLVNLGYGSITDGWSQGDANVPTTFGLFPDAGVLQQVPEALGRELVQGVTDAAKQLLSPDNYQYSLQSIEDIPWVRMLIDSGFAVGDIDSENPSLGQLLGSLSSLAATGTASPSDILGGLTSDINNLSGTVANGYANLLPIADTATALLITLPLYDADFFAEQLKAGNLIDAIGDPIAADTALIPFAIVFGLSAGL